MPDSELRRRMLKLVGAFFLTWPASAFSEAAARPKNHRHTLRAFIDVLLPRDSYCGSASDFRVDRQLLLLARDDKQFGKLLALGCQWLDMTGTVAFAELPAADKTTVVQWMADSDWNQIPRRFYELLRQTSVEAYYSDPRAWKGLALNAPPQPLGYPPPWQ